MAGTQELGVWAVGAARSALDARYRGGGPTTGTPPEARVLSGVFVTLEQYPSRALRGCVGFPLPVLPLGQAVREAALAAATEDPRFPPVEAAELEHLIVEVSILTRPERISASEPAARVAAVRVGRDGLIVRAGRASGLLLPQVAVEQGWNAEEFLDGTCVKAGLAPDAWRRASTEVERFHAEVFGESSPRGPVVALAAPGARAEH